MKKGKRPFTLHYIILTVMSALFFFSGCGASKNMLARIFKDTANPSDLNSAATFNRPVADPDAAYQLARHFQKQGRHRLAIEELLKVVRAAPDHANAYNALGVSYDRLREFDMAAAAYQEALDIDPSLAYVHNNIGYSLLLQGNLETAAAAFETAVSLDSGTPRYQNNLDLALARLGKHQPDRSAPVMLSAVAAIPEKSPVSKVPATLTANITEPIIIFDMPDTEADDMPATTKAPAVYYTILLGVFYDLEKALAALEHARENRLDAPYITKVERRGPYKPYYRVRAGKYEDRDLAVRLAADIRTVTPMPAYITQVVGTPDNTVSVAEIKVEDTVTVSEIKVEDIHAKPVIIQSNADIEILNGNGVRHMARGCRQYLAEKGIPVERIANAEHFFHPKTVIYYSPGYYGQARQILDRFQAINAAGTLVKSSTMTNGIRIVLGRDMVPVADKLGQLMKRGTPAV